MMSEDLAQKKLRGSGGYVIARVTDEEQKKGNLGGPELFLAGVGRLNEDRFEKHFCNKCEKEYPGSPAIVYENPNEDVGEGVTLLEKGEYKCKTCNSTIAQYRKFDTTAQNQQPAQSTSPQTMMQVDRPTSSQIASKPETSETEGFISLQSFIGMLAYNSEAELVGKVKEIGLRKIAGNMNVIVKIGEEESQEQAEIPWSGISKIGDIVLLGANAGMGKGQSSGICPSCGHQNEIGAAFCEECGTKMS